MEAASGAPLILDGRLIPIAKEDRCFNQNKLVAMIEHIWVLVLVSSSMHVFFNRARSAVHKQVYT